MRIAVIQSCYIPWKGFFGLIGRCDQYAIYDRVQYVKRHWHNRNRITTANGLEWLTIPVVTKGRFEYSQLHGGFEHEVTALDLLFNTGPDAPRCLNHSV